MAVDRLERVNSLLKRVIGESVFRVLQGDDVNPGTITVTEVACAKNLRNATVKVSVFGEPDEQGNYSYPGIARDAYSVSQYFKMDNTEIQVRTSGYAKFSDIEIPAEVLSGAKTIDITGVLSLYQGSIQLTVNYLSDFVVDGKPLTR